MKKTLSIFIFICFAASQVVWANKIYYDITEIWQTQIQIDLQNLIDNAAVQDTIVVTGINDHVSDFCLTLNIPANRIVVWQATYTVPPYSTSWKYLIVLSGDGTFEVFNGTLVSYLNNTIKASGANSTIRVSGTGKVSCVQYGHAITTNGNVEIKDNAEISAENDEVIETTGSNSMITVSGGTVTSNRDNAIIARGINAKVFVRGGIVSTDTYYNAPVIYMIHKENSELNIIVSGTAQVIAKRFGNAIISYGSVLIKDQSYISAAIKNAIVVEENNPTVTVCGASKVEASGARASTIFIRRGNVEVKDNAQVIAKEYSKAIVIDHPQGSISISGGVVFATTDDIANVIDCDNFTGPTNTGVVLAWNKDAGNIIYPINSTADILKLPESATACWDKKGEKNGITYTQSNNTGFIPLDVTVTGGTGISENDLTEVKVYPNPTTGEFKIQNLKFKIQGVEVFDVMGRKQSHLSLVTRHETVLNISNLQSGIYFVRIATEQGVVMRKVVKQ